jgi:hypothetical protein
MAKTTRRTRGRPADVFRLSLTINGTLCGARPIDPGFHRKAFDLLKPDGTASRIAQRSDGGLECDCGDATFRGGGGHLCKHHRAMVALGLLDGPRRSCDGR